MKKLTFISILLLLAATSINAQQNEFPKLTGPYLGQELPGMKFNAVLCFNNLSDADG